MAAREYAPAIGLKRLQVSSKMMNAAQQGMLMLRSYVMVAHRPHVHVADGGQVVIGALQTGGCKHEEKTAGLGVIGVGVNVVK